MKDFHELESEKMRSSKRTLVLGIIDGTKPKSSTGNVDPRIITGGNKLYVIMDPQSTIWYFKYDSGGLPEPLKQRFSNFVKAKEFATEYFKNRNIEIKEILD